MQTTMRRKLLQAFLVYQTINQWVCFRNRPKYRDTESRPFPPSADWSTRKTLRRRLQLRFDFIRLQFDRATTIRRPMLRLGCCTAA